MQNKGFVKVFAVLLTLVCVFYLSFSFVTRHYTNKAKEIANGDPKVEQDYLDSLSNEKVMLWNWTLKDCREMEISLGLDLKGGMNVILEVSVPDVIRALADNKPDEIFNYDQRIPVENGSFLAWGYLTYTRPLTEKQASDYELRPAPDNPDRPRPIAEQMKNAAKLAEADRGAEAPAPQRRQPDRGDR